jgi:putative transposase
MLWQLRQFEMTGKNVARTRTLLARGVPMFNLPAPPQFRGLHPDVPVTIYHRHLPHWRQEGATYFVTFRLEDALPQAKLRELRGLRQQWEATHPPPRSKTDWQNYAREVTQRAEHWLDQGYGACHFREPRFAQLLSSALLHFQEQRYFVSCFVIMPNHCHLVIRPYPGHDLEGLLGVCKGYVAREVNRALNRTGALWQQESYDRIVRDEEHLYKVIQYIGRNPAQAGLAKARWVRWIHPTWAQAGCNFES